jgi:hypothetical protein
MSWWVAGFAFMAVAAVIVTIAAPVPTVLTVVAAGTLAGFGVFPRVWGRSRQRLAPPPPRMAPIPAPVPVTTPPEPTTQAAAAPVEAPPVDRDPAPVRAEGHLPSTGPPPGGVLPDTATIDRDRLREARRARRLTRRDVIDAVGIDPARYRLVEDAGCGDWCTVDELAAIARVVGVAPATLLTRDHSPDQTA